LGKTLNINEIPDGLFLRFWLSTDKIYQKVCGGVIRVNHTDGGEKFVPYSEKEKAKFVVIDYEG